MSSSSVAPSRSRLPGDLEPATAGPVRPEPARRPARGLARRAAEWAALLALFGVTLEVACRVEDWVRFRTPFLSRARSQEDLLVRDADGAHGRANARFQKWVMNGLGMRGPEVPAQKAPGTFRIVTVGASETYGLYESPGAEFPRQLEDSLQAAAARCAPAPRIEVLNAGMPGMSLPTITQDVRNRLRRLSPDVVLVYPTPAGFLDVEPPRAATPDSSAAGQPLPARYALHPRAAQRLRNQLKLLLPDAVQTRVREWQTARSLAARPAGWRYTQVPADRLALFDAELRALVGAVRAIGATPVLATHANAFTRPGTRDRDLLVSWEKFYPRAPGPVILAFDAAARDVTLRVARDSSLAAVDVAARLTAAPGETFADFVHFTDLGASHVADVLAPALLAQARGASGTGCATR